MQLDNVYKTLLLALVTNSIMDNNALLAQLFVMAACLTLYRIN